MDTTQVLVHARQTLHHWATPQPRIIHFLKFDGIFHLFLFFEDNNMYEPYIMPPEIYQ